MADDKADYSETWNKIIEFERDTYGDECAALAENIARNATESVRQQRNLMRAGVQAQKPLADYIEEVKLDLAPQNERNTEFSFKVHLKAVARQSADELAAIMKAKTFMGVSPNSEPVVLKLSEYHAGNYPTIGPAPVSDSLAIPIPPQYTEAQVAEAQKRLTTSWKERHAAQKARLGESSGAKD
jgi:hypothetical protein